MAFPISGLSPALFLAASLLIGSPEPANVLDFIPLAFQDAVRDGTCTVDVSSFLQDAIDSLKKKGGGILYLPAGVYCLSRTIDLVDTARIVLVGDGEHTILKPLPYWPGNANLIDVSGSTDLEFHDFRVDGVNIARPRLELSLLYGDGTTDHPQYGRIAVRHVTVRNWEQQGFGIGSNGGHTVEDITYENNVFLDSCTSPAYGFASHPIDTGASGTKRRFRIIGNDIQFGAWPSSPATGGSGIFAGHGMNFDFEIRGNRIVNPPAHGISLYARPFRGESCGFSGGVIADNTITGAGWAGVACFGGNEISIQGNVIENPGRGTDPDAVRVGISVTFGISGTARLNSQNVRIGGNVIRDTQAFPTLEHAIYVYDAVTDPQLPSHGLIWGNLTRGETGLCYFFDGQARESNWGPATSLSRFAPTRSSNSPHRPSLED